MDSGSQAAVDGGDGRSGGKISKRRQTAARKKTPYNRPTSPLQEENPNWLDSLVFPAKFVAGGASKVLSSFWNPKSGGSPSSCDFDSEAGMKDDCDHDENLHDGGAELNQNKGSSSGKSEILHLIEQLLMLECFSREECDKLINIINSRVEDDRVDAGPTTVNPEISKKVIMKTRKMIAENPVGSSLKSNLDNTTHGSKSPVTKNNEVQRSHSKAIVLVKPNKILSLEAPKLRNETANINSKDMKATKDIVPTKALSLLPTIKEKYQIAQEKDLKDDKADDDANRVEENCDMITEYAEAADVIHASQGNSNTNCSPTGKRAATKTRKYNTRKRRPRGK